VRAHNPRKKPNKTKLPRREKTLQGEKKHGARTLTATGKTRRTQGKEGGPKRPKSRDTTKKTQGTGARRLRNKTAQKKSPQKEGGKERLVQKESGGMDRGQSRNHRSLGWGGCSAFNRRRPVGKAKRNPRRSAGGRVPYRSVGPGGRGRIGEEKKGQPGSALTVGDEAPHHRGTVILKHTVRKYSTISLKKQQQQPFGLFPSKRGNHKLRPVSNPGCRCEAHLEPRSPPREQT